MLKAIRRNLSPPTAIAVVALVFAMSGGAIAASNYAGSAEVSKQAKKAVPGPKGPRGKQGPVGPRGDVGPKGDAGPRGEVGPQGAKGDTGDPWTAGGTLPSGATLGGTWIASTGPEVFPGKGVGGASISFGIPLKAAPAIVIVKKDQEGVEHAAECPGILTAPKAAKGTLCLYTAQEAGLEVQAAVPTPVGALLSYLGPPSSGNSGIWVVTAP